LPRLIYPEKLSVQDRLICRMGRMQKTLEVILIPLMPNWPSLAISEHRRPKTSAHGRWERALLVIADDVSPSRAAVVGPIMCVAGVGTRQAPSSWRTVRLLRR
jgi:hypothetical protein